jgi:hypothetical protein
MAQCTITVTAMVSWWVRPYIQAVALFSFATGMQPDVDKVASTCMRGVRLTFR